MNITLRWVLPSTRESGKPLAVEDIRHVAVEVSADAGVNWSLLGVFPPNVLSTELTDLDFGTWSFRGVVEDVKGRQSNPLVATFVNEDTSPPSALVTLEALPA